MLHAPANNYARVWINHPILVNQIMIPHTYNQKITFPCPPQVQLGPNLVLRAFVLTYVVENSYNIRNKATNLTYVISHMYEDQDSS